MYNFPAQSTLGYKAVWYGVKKQLGIFIKSGEQNYGICWFLNCLSSRYCIMLTFICKLLCYRILYPTLHFHEDIQVFQIQYAFIFCTKSFFLPRHIGKETVLLLLQVIINRLWKHTKPYIKGFQKMWNVSTFYQNYMG